MNLPMEMLRSQVASQPYPVMFATISGAHLYGFASEDSDFDLRGAHVLPARDVLSLDPPKETTDTSAVVEGHEVDIVTHDVKKFFGLLLKRNGYGLEQVMSPLVVHSTPEHRELIALMPKLVTRHHCHHYLSFAENQWKEFSSESPPHLKPLLYLHRVLLSGIHLMRTGEVEANLVTLATEYHRPDLFELIEAKVHGKEKALAKVHVEQQEASYEELAQQLRDAGEQSTLATEPSARPALNDLLIRLRLG